MAKSESSLTDFDLNALDKEWHRQPKLYEDAAVKLADAIKDRDEAKNRAAVVAAHVELEIRSDPEAAGLDKSTDAAIKAAAAVHKKNLKAQQAVIDAAHRVNLFEGLCRALEHRKRALEKEVDLFLAGYFGEPRTSSTGKENLSRMGYKKGVKNNRE